MSFSTLPFALLLLIFTLGLFLIVKGGDAFVDAASWIARVSHVPQFIIGATIVSLATTLPELLVSLFAARAGSADFAVGNAIGSVSANTGLILAVCLLVAPSEAPRKLFFAKGALLLGAISILFWGTRTGTLSPLASALLMLLFCAFLAENLYSARQLRASSNAAQSPTQRSALPTSEIGKNAFLFVLGAAAIAAGSQLLVNTARELAVRLAVPEVVIAVTVVAVGTALPELITCATALAKGQSGLSVGNLLGANIIDIALILPLCSLVNGAALSINTQSLHFDLPVCLACIFIGMLPTLITQKFQRWQGGAMLALYVSYLVCVVVR